MLRKRIIRFIVSFILIFILGMSVNAYKVLSTVKMNLTFSYQGIEKGLNPDGSKFNVFEIKSKDIINSVYEELHGSGLSIDEINNNIVVEPIMPDRAVERVKSEQKEGNQYYYIPYEFSITYKERYPMEQSNSIKVLTALSEVYTVFFFENYAEKNTILQDEKIDIDQYEYIEIADVYSNKIDSMINYLDFHRKENEEFRAKSTGETFDNIIYMLTNLKNIDIEKYKSHILHASIAKDRILYLNKVRYIGTTLERSYKQEKNNTKFISDTLEKYDAKITSSLFIPTIDENYKLYMNKTQTGLDYITQQAYDSGLKAAEISDNINKNDYLIKSFSKDTQASQKDMELMNKMLSDIDEKLVNISNLALQTDNEFMEQKTMNYLSFSTPRYLWGNLYGMGTILKMFIISFFIACFNAAVRENHRASRDKKKARREQKYKEKKENRENKDNKNNKDNKENKDNIDNIDNIDNEDNKDNEDNEYQENDKTMAV
ncbi:MAG TPA: hypothetical protein GXX75_19390 [Clostridiales bacterium]|nr:hypothetical protein [Clostridiales bacterium]